MTLFNDMWLLFIAILLGIAGILTAAQAAFRSRFSCHASSDGHVLAGASPVTSTG